MRLPWWIAYDRNRSPEEDRAYQLIMVLFFPIAVVALAIVYLPVVGGIGLKGNNAFLPMVALAFPPSLLLAKLLGQRMKPDLFREAEKNWRRRNGINS